MHYVIYLALTLATALLTGFGLSVYALEDGRRVTAREYGPWYGWPEIGGTNLDPYARASLARSGAIQLGRAEGVAFHAKSDGNGQALSGDCDYIISGRMPVSSAWSIQIQPSVDRSTALRTSDRNAGFSSYLTNNEIVYEADGRFMLNLSARARPGNSLRLPKDSFRLTLRIYDTNAFVTLGSDKIQLPTIARSKCA